MKNTFDFEYLGSEKFDAYIILRNVETKFVITLILKGEILEDKLSNLLENNFIMFEKDSTKTSW